MKADIQKHDIPGIKEELSNLRNVVIKKLNEQTRQQKTLEEELSDLRKDVMHCKEKEINLKQEINELFQAVHVLKWEAIPDIQKDIRNLKSNRHQRSSNR